MPSTLGAWTRTAICAGVVCLAAAGLRAQALASLPATQPPLQAAGDGTEGERIAAVRVVTDTGQVLEQNPATLPVQAKQPFQSEQVREGLRQLYRSGRYADVRAEATRTGEGLRLDFVVRPNFFVNLVQVTGLQEPPGDARAVAALRLNLGEPFRESALKDALDRLRQTLQDEGLYEAKLDYQLAPHAETHQMDILVNMDAGPRARIGTVTLHNPTGFADQDLQRRSTLRPGHKMLSSRLETATQRLRKFLVGKDYLGSRITIHRGDYDVSSHSVPLTVDVITGPRVRVALTGAKISAKNLRKLLPIYEEGEVDEDLLQEGRRNIRDYLERDGYFDADVRFEAVEPSQAESKGKKNVDEVITYGVTRGKRHRLRGIAFAGNKYFGDDLLHSLLHIQTAAFGAQGKYIGTRGLFSHRLLQDDAASISSLYFANGFRQASVKAETQDDYKGKQGDIFVRFNVSEGMQTRVADLKIEGNHAFSDDEMLGVIGSTPGQPYSEFNVSTDRDNILALYYNEGFPEARFTADVQGIPEENSTSSPASGSSPGPPDTLKEPEPVHLIYRIAEGTQVKISSVLTGGYEHTHLNVIQREVKVKPGPLREGDVVESQRQLYNLGVFSRVSIAPQNPSGTDPEKTMVVLVEEAKRYTIGYGFGIEVQRLGGAGTGPVGGTLRASPRGLFEITKNNFTGRADALSFKIRASTLQGRGLLSYTAPNYFGHPNFSLQLTALADKTRDVLTFTSTRYEASSQLAQQVSLLDRKRKGEETLLYRYSFRRVLVDASSLHIAPEQIPLLSQPTRVSLFGVTWFRERRDNPADATRGDFNNLDVSLAGKPIGSSASFVRLFFQNSTFHPLQRRYVFARSVRFGAQTPIGNTLSSEIPLPERFFAGGGNSLRGFGLNQAGPRDPKTGFPVGGQAMLIFNQEFRFPMRLPFVGTRLGGAIFYDAGNIFANVRSITLRTTPPAPIFSAGQPGVCQLNCSNELNYFSHTIGFGLRYATPIGPVRVDLGYQLNSVLFLVPDGTGGLRTSRLPRFQFFFNLGSIF